MTRVLQGFTVAAVGIAACLAVGVDGDAQGAGARRADMRTPIQLSATERAQLRRGMRAFLERVEGIVEGAAENDMARVATNAKRAGMAMVHYVPIALAAKLPPEFVLLSIDTHQKFDSLSLAARGDPEQDGGSEASARHPG